MTLLTRFYPLIAPFNRRLLGDAKPDVEVLQKEETERVAAPAILPGMLERATDTDEISALSYHLTDAVQTEVVHAPVLRFTYRDALVGRSGFTTSRHQERYGTGIRFPQLSGSLGEVSELRYCHSYVAWRYFGHWLTDSIPTALIDPDQGDLWMPPHPSWDHAGEYLDTLGLNVLDEPTLHVENLIVYQDFGQGSHKQARYAAIQEQLHARYGAGTEPSERVYIRRGMTGVARFITNEDALIEELVKRNWRILDVATADVAELQRELCCARVIVGIDGSHLDHAHLTLRPGGAMVALVPQDRFSVRQIGLNRANGVAPGLVVLKGRLSEGYYADLDEILRTVEMAETAALQAS